MNWTFLTALLDLDQIEAVMMQSRYWTFTFEEKYELYS